MPWGWQGTVGCVPRADLLPGSDKMCLHSRLCADHSPHERLSTAHLGAQEAQPGLATPVQGAAGRRGQAWPCWSLLGLGTLWDLIPALLEKSARLSQNPRLVWGGKELQAHPMAPPAIDTFHSARLLQALMGPGLLWVLPCCAGEGFG